MENPPRTRSRRRLWLFAAVVAVVAVAVVQSTIRWQSKPRFDRRLIGSWSDGVNVMTISADGRLDQFCGRFEELYRKSWFTAGGPFHVRTSGDQFQIVTVRGTPRSFSALMDRIVGLVKGRQLDFVNHYGTVVDIRADAIVLNVVRYGNCEYRRVDAAERTPITLSKGDSHFESSELPETSPAFE